MGKPPQSLWVKDARGYLEDPCSSFHRMTRSNHKPGSQARQIRAVLKNGLHGHGANYSIRNKVVPQQSVGGCGPGFFLFFL